MSNFTRKIINVENLISKFEENDFLKEAKKRIISNKVMLTFRNKEATLYFKGRQLCNMKENNNFEPLVYGKYLPIIRSIESDNTKKSDNGKCYSENEYREKLSEKIQCNAKINFTDVLPEIYDYIYFKKGKEASFAAELYKFSPFNADKIILLDIEAAFAESEESTDRIDLVFYHTEEKRLLFIELKRLKDERFNDIENNVNNEVIEQMKRYKARIENEKDLINQQYNNVIDYFNKFCNKNIPHIENKTPLLALLVTEYDEAEERSEKMKSIKQLCEENNIVFLSIGNTENASENTIEDKWFKEALKAEK
jgi:hypothetical protein